MENYQYASLINSAASALVKYTFSERDGTAQWQVPDKCSYQRWEVPVGQMSGTTYRGISGAHFHGTEEEGWTHSNPIRFLL